MAALRKGRGSRRDATLTSAGRRKAGGQPPPRRRSLAPRGGELVGERGASAESGKRLWAPWRLQFIESAKQPGCIFCKFGAEQGEEEDRRNLVVHHGARSFTVLNRYPYNSGHVMVIPRAHLATLEELSRDEFLDLHDELALTAAVLRRVYRPEGLNVGMNLGRIAGAGIVDHLHYHVVPRWAGDTNFMPVLADTRVMVEHLDATWSRIRAGYAGP